MHGVEATDPTPLDTFRYLNYVLKRKPDLNPLVAAKHMKNIEQAFGPEVTEQALARYRRDRSMEQGTYTGADPDEP